MKIHIGFLIIYLAVPQYKRQLTYKSIVNNNTQNIKAPTCLSH